MDQIARAKLTSRWTFIAVCVCLAVVTWVVFAQALRFDFVNYDDPQYVYQNTRITSGITLSSIAWAFTHIHSENWHPLTTITHMLDCQLHGLNAGWHHFTNVLLHCLAVVLLFVSLERMTGALWRSAFVSAVFAVHPLHVESVAWIAERKDVLSAFFFMLTLLAYLHYTRAIDRPVFNRGACRRPWANVQTDAGYTAVRSFTSGLLAAREI